MTEIIVVALFGDPESERALEVAREASYKALHSLGVKIVVRPIVTWGIPICNVYPITIVDGHVVAVGRAPRVDEILDRIKSPSRANRKDLSMTLTAAVVSDDEMFSTAQEISP